MKKTILTHNGSMHTDEVMATVIIKLWAKKNNIEIELKRSREESLINSADIVYDVGGVYDPIIYRFDHHQSEGAGQRPNGIPYAAAGLVWKHFGPELCNQKIWEKIDLEIIQPIDATDNGISIYQADKIEPVTIGLIINAFNANWNEDQNNQDSNFFSAVNYLEIFFIRYLRKLEAKEEAFEEVQNALNQREMPGVLVLNKNYPITDIIDNFPEIIYVVYPDETNNTWKIKAISENKNSFTPKKPFPENWRGQEGEKLKEVSGFSGILFCHRAGFLCGAVDKKSALDIARALI